MLNLCFIVFDRTIVAYYRSMDTIYNFTLAQMDTRHKWTQMQSWRKACEHRDKHQRFFLRLYCHYLSALLYLADTNGNHSHWNIITYLATVHHDFHMFQWFPFFSWYIFFFLFNDLFIKLYSQCQAQDGISAFRFEGKQVNVGESSEFDGFGLAQMFPLPPPHLSFLFFSTLIILFTVSVLTHK